MTYVPYGDTFVRLSYQDDDNGEMCPNCGDFLFDGIYCDICGYPEFDEDEEG